MDWYKGFILLMGAGIAWIFYEILTAPEMPSEDSEENNEHKQ